ncbi:carbamoyltransferase HypF, partial [Veillonellaceae bacterium M1-70]|nr:carbamoyltransferase HypF [Veillonellaceae bacterium M1-70]
PDCGPQVYLLDRAERGRDAISAARRAIAAGKIIAVKGLGGFHLCCDATDETATARLRTLKHRPVKPFAVMMRDSSAVKNACYITDKQQEVLEGYQKPIMLLKRRTDSR